MRVRFTHSANNWVRSSLNTSIILILIMETIKTIKGVDEETWYKLKKLSVRDRVTMGKLLHKIVEEYEKRSESFWKDILNHKGTLTNKEAEEMHLLVRKHRQEYGFRQ